MWLSCHFDISIVFYSSGLKTVVANAGDVMCICPVFVGVRLVVQLEENAQQTQTDPQP